MNAREPSLSQLVVIAHDSRLIILLFISHSLRASRIPSKRGNLHADTRSGIDASWLACRGADYAPRLRSSPRMAQESLVSLPLSTFLLFILLSRTQGGCNGPGMIEEISEKRKQCHTTTVEPAGAVPCFGARECGAPCACSPRRDAAESLLRYPRC